MFLQIVRYMGFKGVSNIFKFIKDKLRKALEERFVLSAYLIAIGFLFLLSLFYDLAEKIGRFIIAM